MQDKKEVTFAPGLITEGVISELSVKYFGEDISK